MEIQPEDIIAAAFEDERGFNPYSDPLDSARFLIEQLKKAGFKIERVLGD